MRVEQLDEEKKEGDAAPPLCSEGVNGIRRQNTLLNTLISVFLVSV